MIDSNHLFACSILVFASACATPTSPADEPPPLVQAELAPGYPVLDGACVGPIPEPTRLVVTSTDFNTGAVGLVDLATRSVTADLAPASSDAIPFVVDGRVFIVNRFGFDYIDELDPADALALVHEWALTPASVDAPANPQALVLDPQDRAWVSLLGAGELQQFTFPTLSAAQPSATLAVDLRAFADDDGIPELGAVIRCGSTLFVAAERIDRSRWVPADETLLIPIDIAGDQPTLHDFDPEHPGADAIELLGVGVGRWRLDPTDASGQTIVTLNSGLERVELGTGQREWLVPAQRFVDAGYDRLQLSGFDYDADGRIWLSAATPDFSSFELVRVDFDLAGDAQLVVVVEGLQSVSGALEIAGHELWFADTTIGASGLRGFDLAADPVSELPESPLAVGLPPMSLAPL